LRAEVESLLAIRQRLGGFLGSPTLEGEAQGVPRPGDPRGHRFQPRSSALIKLSEGAELGLAPGTRRLNENGPAQLRGGQLAQAVDLFIHRHNSAARRHNPRSGRMLSGDRDGDRQRICGGAVTIAQLLVKRRILLAHWLGIRRLVDSMACQDLWVIDRADTFFGFGAHATGPFLDVHKQFAAA
jgi:hypothetical protein